MQPDLKDQAPNPNSVKRADGNHQLALVNDFGRRLIVRIKNYLLPQESDITTPLSREDLSLVANRVDAFLQRPPPPAWMIVRTTLVLFLTCLVWAACSRVDEVTIGDGRVVPASYVQVVQNLEGGIISAIPVQVGDLVRKDQVVMRLDETRFASSVGESQAKNQALMAKVARLQAESTGSSLLMPTAIVQDAPIIAKDEEALYQNRQRELNAGLGILRQQLDQRSQEITEKTAKLKQLTESYDFISKELVMSQKMQKEGVIADVEVLRIQRQHADTRGEMDATRLALPRLEAQRNEAKTKLEGATAKFRADAATELATAKADQAGTSATSVALEDRLARTTVRAPLNGTVKSIRVNTIGGVLQPGMDVMEIVPIEDRLLIEAKVKPADIGFLHPGQPALVKVSAYDYSIYGGLDGQVETISADAVTNDKGESYYLVRIRTPKNALGTADKPLHIIPGMLATVHIQTGEKSILSYLMKPISKAKTEALRER